MSRQILQVFFDQDLIDRPVAAPLVEAQHVTAVGALGEHRAERSGSAELVGKHAGEVRNETVQETVAVLDKHNLGGFGWHEFLGIRVKVNKCLFCNLCFYPQRIPRVNPIGNGELDNSDRFAVHHMSKHGRTTLRIR